MSNKQYVVSNSDRTGSGSFTVPGDEDGGAGDSSFKVEDRPLGKSHNSYVHIDNGWDTNVDVSLRGSHYLDEDMSEAAVDGSPITVSNGAVDFFDITTSHTYIDLSVDPAATPTSGDLTITFQSREQ